MDDGDDESMLFMHDMDDALESGDITGDEYVTEMVERSNDMREALTQAAGDGRTRCSTMTQCPAYF